MENYSRERKPEYPIEQILATAFQFAYIYDTCYQYNMALVTKYIANYCQRTAR